MVCKEINLHFTWKKIWRYKCTNESRVLWLVIIEYIIYRWSSGERLCKDTHINTWIDSGRTHQQRERGTYTETQEFQWVHWPLNALLPTHWHMHTFTHSTHTLLVSRLLNTLPTWQPMALLVKSFPIRCTCIQFHFKKPAGSKAACHRRENITLLFRESRSE